MEGERGVESWGARGRGGGGAECIGECKGGEGVEAMWEWRERGSKMGVKERRGEGAEGRRSGLGAQRFRTAIRFKRKCTLQRFRTATIIIIHAGNHCAHPQPFPIKPVALGKRATATRARASWTRS